MLPVRKRFSFRFESFFETCSKALQVKRNFSKAEEKILKRAHSLSKTPVRLLKTYFFPACFIIGWWTLAFFFTNNPFRTPPLLPSIETSSSSLLVPNSLEFLSSISRREIHLALSGDIPLMIKLIEEWDFDAQILEEQGIAHVRRLPQAELVFAHTFFKRAREIIPSHKPRVPENQEEKPKTQVLKLLPQTFVAASFLLALTTPENIVALPAGLRAQTSLYSETFTEQIPLDINRHRAEELYRAKPDLAFVADYSDPATLETLIYQGIPLITLKSIQTVSQVEETIRTVGTMIHRPYEAHLLASFIKAAFFAIDNRLLACHRRPKTMVLNYYAHYSIPTTKTINGDLLKRLKGLGYPLLPEQKEPAREWAIPVTEEEIMINDPDCLIITSNAPESLKKQIVSHPILHQLSAVKNKQLYCIEEAPHAPTQYIVLAYYDLAQALMKVL